LYDAELPPGSRSTPSTTAALGESTQPERSALSKISIMSAGMLAVSTIGTSVWLVPLCAPLAQAASATDMPIKTTPDNREIAQQDFMVFSHIAS